MIVPAKKKDKEDIINELKKNMANNIYLYIDIYMYGVKNDFVKVWVEKEHNQIRKIVLKYFNSFQLYVADGVEDYEDILELINLYRPAMVSGPEWIIQKVHPLLESVFEDTYGVVLKQAYMELDQTFTIPQLANKEDMQEIASLICSDDGIGAHYNVKELKKQFINRIEDKTGRNYIIRKNNRIVAHYATYAEAPGIAVMGGLIVSPNYRGSGYAKILHSHLSSLLLKEEREVFLFCHEKDALKMYLGLGAEICAKYGKLTLKKEKEY